MSPAEPSEGYRVAIIGATSLLGKELISVLKERRFPIARIVEIESDSGADLDLPVLDLDKTEIEEPFNPEIEAGEIDLVFMAARPNPLPAFLGAGPAGSEYPAPIVIDLGGSSAESGTQAPRIALLEQESSSPRTGPPGAAVSSAHPASIVLCLLLLRLASRIELSAAVAHVFSPVSHLGSRAVEELQKQTLNLLSFQKAPRSIFGAQLAFNLLPQLAGSGAASWDELQSRVRGEVDRYLQGRTPSPALRLLQAPVFYSLGISLYVKTKVAINPARAAELLAGEGVRMRRAADPVSSQVEVTGSDEILIHSVLPDANHPTGFWIWAVADNLRLAAQNAVELAEELIRDRGGRPSGANGKAATH